MSAAKKIINQDEGPVSNPKDLILASWRDKVVLQNVAEVKPGHSYQAAVGVGNNMEPSPLLDLVLNHQFKHIVQEGNICFEKELNTASLMLLTPNLFIEKPLAAILDPSQAAVKQEADFQKWSIKFNRASEKNKALEDVTQCLSAIVKSSVLIADICGVLDELFTNAVFNAPFTNLNSATNQNINRNDLQTAMPDPHFGEAFLGLDSERIIVGVRDPFGSLNLNTLFGRIRKCYTDGVDKTMNMGKGGAGIGSYMVYSASASYYAAIDKGYATIICCSIPLKMSNRVRAELPKNIHYTD